MSNINLPTVSDFRKNGRFYHLENLDIYHDIPEELLCHIFPYYFFSKKQLNKSFIENYKYFCINLKKRADYDDYLQELLDQKELLLRRLEDKIRSGILKKNVSCKKNSLFSDEE